LGARKRWRREWSLRRSNASASGSSAGTIGRTRRRAPSARVIWPGMAPRFARAGHLRAAPVETAVQRALGDAELARGLAGAVAVNVDEDDCLAEALGQRGHRVEHLASAPGAHRAVLGADVDGLEVLGQRGGAHPAGGGAQALRCVLRTACTR
jgi:hypothetical protein